MSAKVDLASFLIQCAQIRVFLSIFSQAGLLSSFFTSVGRSLVVVVVVVVLVLVVVVVLVVVLVVAGAVIDRIGYRLNAQILMTIGCILGFALIHSHCGNAHALVTWIGFTFAVLEQNSLTILARTYESLPMNVQGTGYGIMALFLNGGLIAIPPLVGLCAKVSGSYEAQNQIYIISLGGGVATSLAMAWVDGRGKQVLNLTTEQMAERSARALLLPPSSE
eukprot:TRINITY_DN11203_c0_g1_i1.p1 TRINITY_DN11203_c0_g1~~TRINITY_DN11203_c0_g1_i1.p1  ORF type:complete len:221 (-),score=0.55 TRINITY_DN11203_c0_g1_i1:84-746(-)